MDEVLLITEADLLAGLGVASVANAEEKIELAQQMVAAYLQARSIVAHDVTEKHTVRFPLVYEEPLEFRDGPISAILALTIDHIEIDDITADSSGQIDNLDLIILHWGIRYLPGIAKDAEVEATYTAGWTAETLPLKVKNAIIQTAVLITQYPNINAISERIGDYAITYRDSTEEGIVYAMNSRICLLLHEFKKVTL